MNANITKKNSPADLSFVQSRPKVKVYWFTHTPWQRDWESDRIQELLTNDDFDIELENVADFQTRSPNSMVVFNTSLPYVQYLEQYDRDNYPFIGIHLSDEYLNNVYNVYTYKSCKAIFRNYYQPVLEQHPKVTTFALGYKLGFWNNYKGSSPETKSGFQSYEPSYFQQLFDVTMEDNEIIPFICEDSWEKCKTKILELGSDDQLYEDTRRKVCTFWKRYKNLLRKKLCDAVKHHLLS